MRELERAYIAGFFDADGSVTCIQGRKTKFGNPIYTIAFCLYNNRRDILEGFQKSLGGKIYYRPRKRNAHEMASMLYMRNQPEIQNALRLLIPYLRIKKQAAQLALEYLNLREPIKHLRSAHNPITPEQLEILKSLRLENMKRSMHAKPITLTPVAIKILHCKKCGHEFRRYAKGLPRQCPKCWATNWRLSPLQ